jgi:hypothetical protein
VRLSDKAKNVAKKMLQKPDHWSKASGKTLLAPIVKMTERKETIF